jgi:hypothetical protein
MKYTFWKNKYLLKVDKKYPWTSIYIYTFRNVFNLFILFYFCKFGTKFNINSMEVPMVLYFMKIFNLVFFWFMSKIIFF